jgi:hypothetical protein
MTLSSMFSPAKKADKQFLLELADLIELLVSTRRTDALDLAERYGEHYVALEQKITTYDYSREDSWYETPRTTP